MIILLILLGIVVIITFILFLIISSTLRVEIKNLQITNYPEKFLSSYSIVLGLYFWDTICIFSYTLDNKKLKKIYDKEKSKVAELEKMKEYLKPYSKTWEKIKKLDIKVRKLKLTAKIGTEDAVLTSFLVAILASLISIFLPNIAINQKEENYQYDILPLYNKNVYDLQLNCIIQMKMVHIIYVIYIFLKKKGDLKYERTSHRGSYDYSYE